VTSEGWPLPLALIAMLILTMLVLTVLNLGAVEPQISKNLSDTARARHMAEAGIEWAFDCLADQDLSAFLAGPDGVQNTSDDTLATSVAGQAIGARMDATFCRTRPTRHPARPRGRDGTFAVTIRNDSIGAGGRLCRRQVLPAWRIDAGASSRIPTASSSSRRPAPTASIRRITAVVVAEYPGSSMRASLPGMQRRYLHERRRGQPDHRWDATGYGRTATAEVRPATGADALRHHDPARHHSEHRASPTRPTSRALRHRGKQNTVQGKSQSHRLLTPG